MTDELAAKIAMEKLSISTQGAQKEEDRAMDTT
jgi:hypothetical protein